MKVVREIRSNNGKLITFKMFADEYLNFHQVNWTDYFHAAKEGLYDLIPNYYNEELNLINDLIDNFERIIKATSSEIPNIINEFTTGNYNNLLIDATGNKTPLCNDIELIFNYKGFRKSAKASWFCEKLEIKACLYCNAQFTLAVGKDGNSKKLLFQLDHYYNRYRYPFLSLTLGNLIPCCSSCNIAKSKKDFNSINFFHPYFEDLSSNFTFKINEDSILDYLLDKRDVNLLKPIIYTKNIRVINHIKEFRLNYIYDKHTDIVEELVLKSLYYNETKRNELKHTFEELNLDNSMIDRFILGNYTLDSEINRRPLSKLAKDIGKQLKIIK